MIKLIFEKINNNEILTKEDAIALLNIKTDSRDFYELLQLSNNYARTTFGNKGYVFAQIGLNAEKCAGNCKFCSLGKDNYALSKEQDISDADIISIIKNLDFTNLDSLFLMTTANYSMEKYFEIAKKVKELIPSRINLVANIGDFDDNIAKQLKQVGFYGIYHIVRLREGIDTDIPVSTRIKSIELARKNGLELFYCIEPIGTEHTYDEIADEMIRARDYEVNIMAVMGRTPVAGTPYENTEEISEIELTKIVAVTLLVTRPTRSMNIHEPKQMPLLAGVNQLYAEIGTNPRDTSLATENNRGIDTNRACKLLKNIGYTSFS